MVISELSCSNANFFVGMDSLSKASSIIVDLVNFPWLRLKDLASLYGLSSDLVKKDLKDLVSATKKLGALLKEIRSIDEIDNGARGRRKPFALDGIHKATNVLFRHNLKFLLSAAGGSYAGRLQENFQVFLGYVSETADEKRHLHVLYDEQLARAPQLSHVFEHCRLVCLADDAYQKVSKAIQERNLQRAMAMRRGRAAGHQADADEDADDSDDEQDDHDSDDESDIESDSEEKANPTSAAESLVEREDNLKVSREALAQAFVKVQYQPRSEKPAPLYSDDADVDADRYYTAVARLHLAVEQLCLSQAGGLGHRRLLYVRHVLIDYYTHT